MTEIEMTRNEKINKAFRALRNLEARRVSLNEVGSVEECAWMDAKVKRAEKRIDWLMC